MATKIKKISELEQIAELSSFSNIIIEENGKAKRFAASNLDGKVKTVNGVEPDENGNIEVEVGGGVTSWNDLTDRPFYEEGTGATIEWDGNIEGLEVVADVGGAKLVKVSDKAPTDEELVKAVYTEEGDATVYPLDGDRLIDLGSVYLISDTGCMIVNKAPMEWQGVQFATNGIYHIVGSVVVTKLTYGSTTVHKLDEKFIPESIARVEDIPTGGATSWNDLTDRPFYEEGTGATIEWDGNTEGREVWYVDGLGYCKVSDTTIPQEEVFGGSVTRSDGTTMDGIPIEAIMVGTNCYGIGNMILVAYATNVTFMDVEMVLPDTGVYFVYTDSVGYISKLTYGSTTVHQIDEKFIPDTIARQNEVFSRHWDDLKDAPFYDRIIEVLPETSLTLEGASSTRISNHGFTIDEGEEFVIEFDGVSYTCIAWDNPSGFGYIGNGSLTSYDGKGENVPFLITQFGDIEIYTAMPGTYTIKFKDPNGYGHPVDTEITTVYTERYFLDNFSSNFEEDKEYIVTFNGTDYYCTAWGDTDGIEVAVGNGSLISSDYSIAGEDVPFFLSTSNYEKGKGSLRVPEPGSYTIKAAYKEFRQIDEKFIPDSVKLPTVTTENNGAILQVVDGVWTAVNLTNVSIEGA